MKKNMSMTDRLLRAAIAIAVVVLYLADQLTGTAAVILGVLSVIFLATGITGFCPLYKVLGISTLKDEAGEGHPGGAHHKGAH
jgi:Na+(H+)/acetate symporter ActP